MKIKITLLLSIVFSVVMSLNGFSQANRIVLYEEGTALGVVPVLQAIQFLMPGL